MRKAVDRLLHSVELRTTQRTVIHLLAICLLLTAVGFAQSTTEGAISGTVYDANGAALPKATVTVKNIGTNAVQTTTSDASGYFRVTNLVPTSYEVTVTASGFATYKAEKVIVEVGRTTELAPKLNVGSTSEQVIVTAEAPTVNTTSADFAPVVNQVAVQGLPINGGRWSNFALLTPGVNNNASGFGLVSVRGINTLMNNNTIDGASNNQAFFSEERGRTRAGYSTPKVAVQEFQVNTSNYSAEYGRAAGGVLNTVTKSGSNDWHGDAYFFYRDQAWGATNPFTTIAVQTSPGVYTVEPYKPSDIRRISGIGIGGPIIKNKLFVYFTYDWYYRNFPGTGIPFSSATFYAAPTDANLTTLATRLGISKAAALTDWNNGITGLNTMLGPVPRTGEQYIWLPKIDWNINDKNHASFTVDRMRWASPAGIQTQATNNYGIRSFGNDYVKDTWGIAKLDTMFTSNLANEFRFQYGRDFEFENNQTPTPYEQSNLVNPPGYTNPLGLPPYVQLASGNLGFNFGTANFLMRPQYPNEYVQQYADTVTWQKGRHSFKFGGDIIHTSDQTQNLRNQYGSYNYTSLTDYFSDFYGKNTCTSGKLKVPCYSNFTQAFGPLGLNFATNDYGFFAEDTWKATPRLTITMGLRYEYEQMPSPQIANPAVPQTSQLPSDKNNWGPRVGFAYDVFGDGNTALRGGFGIYYGRIINSTIYNALINTGSAAGQLSFSYTNTQGGAVFPQIFSNTPNGSLKPTLVYFNNGFQNPAVYQSDLSLQHEFKYNIVLSINYLGSFGRELPNFVDTNLPTPSSSVNYTVIDPTGVGPLKNGSIVSTPLYSGARPNVNYGAMTSIFSGVNSTYNALAVLLNKRFSNNVQFNVNYTWSHALDYGQNDSTFSDTNDLLFPNCLKCEYGNSNFDVRQRFIVSAVLDSPWKVKGWAGYLANGWELAPIYQAQTGLPFSLVTSGNAPGAVASGSYNGSGGPARLLETGRNTYNTPRTQVVDMRLSKNIPIKERFNLQVLAEAFNLLNHVNYTNEATGAYSITGSTLVWNAPSTNGKTQFQTLTNANSNFAYTSRQIQIGAKFTF